MWFCFGDFSLLELLQTLFFPHDIPERVGRPCRFHRAEVVSCVFPRTEEGLGRAVPGNASFQKPRQFPGPFDDFISWLELKIFYLTLAKRPGRQGCWYPPHTNSGSSFHRRGPLVIALLTMLYLVFVGSFGVVRTVTISCLIASNGENYLRCKVPRVVCKHRITVCVKLLALDCLGRFSSSRAPLSSRPGCP